MVISDKVSQLMNPDSGKVHSTSFNEGVSTVRFSHVLNAALIPISLEFLLSNRQQIDLKIQIFYQQTCGDHYSLLLTS